MIRKSKILSLNPYLQLIPRTGGVYVGVVDPPEAKLKRLGFDDALADGEMVLPSPVGRVSSYNAEGKNLVHKDRPKETAYRTVDWKWQQWDGTWHSKFVDVPYQRYPRTHVAPPALELTLLTDTNGQRVVVTPLIAGNWRSAPDNLIHAVNLILELFGECTFFNEARAQVIDAPIKRLNWQILPKGERPYAVLREQLEPALKHVKEGNRNFIEHRLERVNSYKPDFTAVGVGGFTGYVVFAFPTKGIFLLESILYGNATYVLGDDWEHVSKMTKAEILHNDLHKQRIIHRANWFAKLKQLLS
ncbi:MAG: hypothetical protein JNK33_03100 [Candidatus Doudnabacteria bacterium]|nr:hypothetical protein [Candidatus Doudnabacteria bacterium]